MNYDFSGLNVAKEYSTPIAPGIVKDDTKGGYFVSIGDLQFFIEDQTTEEGEYYHIYKVIFQEDDEGPCAYVFIDCCHSFIEAIYKCYDMRGCLK